MFEKRRFLDLIRNFTVFEDKADEPFKTVIVRNLCLTGFGRALPPRHVH